LSTNSKSYPCGIDIPVLSNITFSEDREKFIMPVCLDAVSFVVETGNTSDLEFLVNEPTVQLLTVINLPGRRKQGGLNVNKTLVAGLPGIP
jgi:hypothetical protein